ncbi:hypothetical protein B0H11DRAFT_2204227 [Mycena galericulata]|nr:hypothetical protein B0H11DRAFT_2204227 [Mycena galericulata]
MSVKGVKDRGVARRVVNGKMGVAGDDKVRQMWHVVTSLLAMYFRARPSFLRLSPEAQATIIAHCAPADLVNLRGTCHEMGARLSMEGAVCWSEARGKLGVPTPPKPKASGNWSEAAYAQFLFGTSPCIARCGKTCSGFLSNYAMRFRVCSKECATRLRSGQSTLSLSHWTSIVLGSDAHALDIYRWLPEEYAPRDSSSLLFIASVMAADEECEQALAYDPKAPNDNECFQWDMRRAARKAILTRMYRTTTISWVGNSTTTKSFSSRPTYAGTYSGVISIRQFMDAAGLQVGTILPSPTLSSLLGRFAMDNTEFDYRSWRYILPQAQRESQAIQHFHRAIAPPLPLPLPRRRRHPTSYEVLSCADCAKTFAAPVDLEQHRQKFGHGTTTSSAVAPPRSTRQPVVPGNTKPFKCCSCNRRFGDDEALGSHRRSKKH